MAGKLESQNLSQNYQSNSTRGAGVRKFTITVIIITIPRHHHPRHQWNLGRISPVAGDALQWSIFMFLFYNSTLLSSGFTRHIASGDQIPF